MLDKARLGKRYVCFTCGTKFYDMNRQVPSCPDCSADQREAPVRDIKSLLSKGGGKRRALEPDDMDEDLDDDMANVDDEENEDDDDMGLLGDDEEEDVGEDMD